MAIIKSYFSVLVLCFLTSVQCMHSSSKNITPQYLDNLLNKSRYNEFINILHIPSKDLAHPSQGKKSYDDQFYYTGMKLGDILLRPGQLMNPDKINDLNAHLKIEFKTWNNGTVPYYVSKTFSDDQAHHIFNVLQHNNQLLGKNVVFQPYKDEDVDYVFIFGGSGYFTNFGNVGGPQVISLPQALDSGKFSHELQHTLGIGHEHDRIDRDEYIKLIPENLNQGLKSQYIKYSSDNLVNLEPYDYYSIMHFPMKLPGYNVSAYDVLEEGIDKSIVGIRFSLTEIDVRRVKRVYPLS